MRVNGLNARPRKKFRVTTISGHKQEAAMRAVFEYIELFYDRIRLHSTLDYVSPVEYEEARAQEVA
jgi:transposase InsO family protein